MIDWGRILELRDEIGPDDFGEVVTLFLSEVEESLAGLAAASLDAKQLEETMHFLKGSALNLGFAGMSLICQTGEDAAAQGHPESVEIDKLHESFERSKATFLHELPSRLAA